MIGTMSDPVGLVCSQMRGRGITLPRDNEWLNACVECFVSNTPNYTGKQLFDFVFEQWTLADLTDVGAPCLPANCVNCTKMVLTGKYAVQINYFLNVAVPLHKQLQKIRRPEAQKNLDVDNERQELGRFKEDTSVRTLKMEITDGVTTVIGFEDQHIPAIKNPLPGEKVVLSGPIEVRKGTLMLKPANVTMLGGEVDVLLVKNATENLLARALRQEENPDPYGVNPALKPLLAMNPEQSQPAPRSPQTTNALQDPFDDGEDEALASLAEALENDSFQEDSPNNRSNNEVRRNPPNIPQVRPTNSSKNLPSKPPKAPTQKSTKQPSITSFLTQPKKASSSQMLDSSMEVDNYFDDDFDDIAANVASLAELPAVNKSVQSHDPAKLKRQLEATYSSKTSQNEASAKNRAISSTDPSKSIKESLSCVGTSPDSRQPNKRKDTPMERDIFGRPKIPRNESNSSSSSEAAPFKNPRHAQQGELADSEELYDWIPPPPKANLDHVRPSHEKGKILIDYTDSSTLDLESVSTQSHRRSVKIEPTVKLTLDEPFPPKEFPCTRTTLGKVVKVVNKLQLRDAKWVLSAIVETKGIEQEMEFSPAALDKIFTVTAEEITRQKEQLKTNPELKEIFNGHLRESQKRIQTLKCEMTIHFKNFISKPVVLDVSKND